MHKGIKVSIKSVYGSDVAYPVCDDAKEFANLAGTKTLTASAIRSIRRLGYAVEVILPDCTTGKKHFIL